ncbi:MAG: dual specificity protein phosphatase [bacterium]
MVFILKNLAVGNLRDAEDCPSSISALLNVADDLKSYKTKKKYHRIPLVDGWPIPGEKMREAIQWIKKHIIMDNILVFCTFGAGRSASVVIGYLCSIGFNYEEAVKFVSFKKPDIVPLPLLAESIKRALKRRPYLR